MVVEVVVTTGLQSQWIAFTSTFPNSFSLSYFMAFFEKCCEKSGSILTLSQPAVVCYSVLLNEFKYSNFQKFKYFHQSVFQLLPVFVC